MTKYQIMHGNQVTTISADDITILPPFVFFVLEGVPNLMLQLDDITSIERIENGEWKGILFDVISRGE